MNKLVFDNNCIIDLEENRPDAGALRRLITAWKSNQLELAVVAIGASENQLSGTVSPSYSDFEHKLHNVGLAEAHEILPLALWDVFYYDHALWPSTEMIELESEVRSILFPGIDTVPPTDIRANSKWRNKMCDVLVAWSCIYHKFPRLVTRDSNFHNHSTELAALGLTEILNPNTAVQIYAP